jgi:transposase InsO family protein
MSEHCRADTVLADQIQEVYHSCRQVYGSPRIHAELQAQGITSSCKRVARLMRERGLSARRPRHRTNTTKSEPGGGSQYTSDAYRATLAEAGIIVSRSRTGNCYDNAVTESFFGTLKGECIDRVSFQTRGQARQIIARVRRVLLQPNSAALLTRVCEPGCF